MTARTSHRAQAEVRSGGASPPVREQLAPLIALAQLLWLDLCLVRVAADLIHGSLSVEGGLALVVAVFLAASLVRGWLRLRRRGARR